tara:strand:- start:58 stop:363 length:306 start_codon:yes stop_codon:yes gene_type:complete
MSDTEGKDAAEAGADDADEEDGDDEAAPFCFTKNRSTSNIERHFVFPSGEMYVVSLEPAHFPDVRTVVIAVHPIGSDIFARLPRPVEDVVSALRLFVSASI